MAFLWMFLLLPIVEIALFVVIGGEIGVWATLALVILAGIAGVALIRMQGSRAALDIQRSLQDLQDPSRKVANRTLLVIAGLLLILPGFFTDALALLLLLPPVRNLILGQIASRARVTRVNYGFPSDRGGARESGVIDGEYVVQDDPYIASHMGPGGSGGDNDPGKSGWTRH